MTTKQLEKIKNTTCSKTHQKNQETGEQQNRASFILHTLEGECFFFFSSLYERRRKSFSPPVSAIPLGQQPHSHGAL